MTRFLLPDLGEGLQEAEIVAWHVNVGDHVVADQPLVSVETDKAVVEVPSPESGRIAMLFAEPGDIVEVGAPLVEFGEDQAAESAAVINVKTEAPATAPAGPRSETRVETIKAAPAARKRALEAGIDLAAVTGTGPNATITVADVEAASRTGEAEEVSAPEGYEPLRGVRRAMARNMERAREEVVRATVHDHADVDAWRDGSDITIRLIRAIAAGVAEAPAVNAWYESRSISRRIHQKIDLGIAMDSEDGLFVPLIRDIANRTAEDLRSKLDSLRRQVRDRKVAQVDLARPTITLSNFGTMAGRHGVMVLVPPQVAILGVGRLQPTVVAVNGEPIVHKILPLSVTTDHRAVTGGEVARFLAAVIADLEQPDPG